MTSDLRERFRQFQVTHTLRYQKINRIEWEYIHSGRGQTLLLLPGALGVADTSFQLIQAFEADYCVVAARYPAGITLVCPLLDGIAELIRTTAAQPVHMLGGSYSGLIAQAFVRRHPDLVSSLILTHTGLPSPLRSYPIRVATALLGLCSDHQLQAAFQALIRFFLPASDPTQAFWRDYFYDLIPRLGRADYLDRLKIGIDFDANYRVAFEQRLNWNGPVLIIDSPHDGIFAEWERQSLRSLYPQAEKHSLAAKGHAASLDQLDQSIPLIKRFLDLHNE
jgi:pimeloyl-ACP methyl ester carboxylesterase